ncbi:MAG: hypothetical protein EBR02_03265 [Alphaproteobacteria bacterium]|nr:hypothetical protein [Alphaproteobacteria bacterium]
MLELAAPKPTIPHYTQQGKIISEEEWAKLNDRLEQVDSRIKSLEELLANVQKDASEVAAENAIKPSESMVLEAKLEELQSRFEALQKGTNSTGALQRVSLLSTFSQLQKAVKNGKPFAPELAMLTQLSNGRASTQQKLIALQPLASLAPQTPETLQQQFLKAVRARQESADDSTSLMGNLRSLVRVRKEGQPQGDDDESIIARAESKLKAGNVDAAAREVAGLSSSASEFFRSWQESAQSYTKLTQALGALELDLAQPDATAP